MRAPRQAAAGRAAGSSCGRPVCQLLGDRRAVASLEFALVLPVLLVLMFGTAEALRAVRAKMLLNAAVAAAAAVASTQSGAVTSPGCETGTYRCAAGNLQDVCQGAMLIMRGLETPTFQLSIAAVTNADTTNPHSQPGSVNVVPLIQWQVYQACPNRGTAFSATGAGSLATLTTPLIPYDNDVAVVVQGSFVYKPAFAYGVSGLFGPTSSGAVTLTATSLVKPRTGALPCIVASTQLTCPVTD